MSGRLRRGAPWLAVGAMAIVAVVAILAISTLQTDDSPRGFASARLAEGGCSVDVLRSKNAITCTRVTRGVYRIAFSHSIKGRPVIATRETCCPGVVGASVDSERTVLLALPNQRAYPVILTVVVP